MAKRTLAPVLVGIALATGAPMDVHADASKPAAAELMQAVEDRDDGDDQIATVTLEIQPRRGTRRLRRFALMRKEAKDRTKLAAFFVAPAEVRNSAFLVHDMKKADDRRWLYLPSIGQVRRLSTGDSRSSFFGSDFVYEDLTNRDPELDEHRLVGSGKFGEWDCWIVESTPKSKRGVEFAKSRSWVWKREPIVVRHELYDSRGKTIKRGEIASLRKVQGIWTWHRGTMRDLRTGSRTRMEIAKVRYDTGLSDERLSESQLDRGAP